MKKYVVKAVLALLALGIVATASAHHSFNMFDRTKLKLIKGNITEWNYNNPHSWLHIEAMNDKGEMETWSFEGASPVHAVRQNVFGNTFFKGEEVTVVMTPLKDGRNAGALCFVVKQSGELAFPNDASCNAGMESASWKEKGWLAEGKHLDEHPANR